jgi:2-polyprenyl-6-methoxyphenol hydroxylase-like FAD-dependent oxidoreductase
LKDHLTKQVFQIKSKYLFGCDGARSQVVRVAKLPLAKQPGGGSAFSALVDVDLSHVMEDRKGFLHFIIRPDEETSKYGFLGNFRMVKPWHE